MPRCEPCGTPQGRPVRGCSRCGAHDQHKHLTLRDRNGALESDIVLCRGCLSSLGWADTTLLAEFVSESERSQGHSGAAVAPT